MACSLKNRIEDFERYEITSALRDSNWVMARAARRLGITERMIGYKIKKYGIKKEVEVTGEGKGIEQIDDKVHLENKQTVLGG